MLVKLNRLLYLTLNVLLDRPVKLPMTFCLNFSVCVLMYWYGANCFKITISGELISSLFMPSLKKTWYNLFDRGMFVHPQLCLSRYRFACPQPILWAADFRHAVCKPGLM